MTDTETLADALPKEIVRVREIQDTFKSLRGTPNVLVEPQIQMMEQDIQAATKAAAAGDTVAMLRYLEELKEYRA